MLRISVLAAPLAIAAACASTPPSPSNDYWRHAAGTRADFATDNQSCGARASRVVPQPRADQLVGGATIPNNRIDQPPRRWTHAVAENAYMDCMAEQGWRLVQR
jgi:hypothetical protein